MIIQHNSSSMNAAGKVNVNGKNSAKSANKLSSGYKINIAADDAAGLSISEKMRWQLRGLTRGSDNAQDGISMLEVGDGALEEVHSILQRINELTVQAANDTYTDAARDIIQKEIDDLKREINNIGNNTEFNTIKLFKSTNVPTATGKATDILVFHEDYNGEVRAGGIIYNGIRYDYDSMELKYDANDNIVAGTYQVEVLNEKGDVIPISLLFDGGSRVPSGRIYELNVDKDHGISIDGITYSWSSIKDTNGNALDPDNITEGRFEFTHAGMTISFSTEKGMDIDSLVSRLESTGMTSYTISSTVKTETEISVNPSVEGNSVKVTQAIQDLIPGNTESNTSYFEMHADDTGIWMSVPADESHGQGSIDLTFRSWADLGITDEDFMQTPMANNSGLNPDSTVTGGEQQKTYTYKETRTGLEISFTIDSEVSKQELIDSINEWKIEVKTNTSMNFIISPPNSNISVGSHSMSLDAYGTQYEMGRNMDTKLELQRGTNIAYDGNEFSFTMQDANGNTYTMKSMNNSSSSLKANIESSLRSYIGSYASNYEMRLNQGRSYPVSEGYYKKFLFTEASKGYWVWVNYSRTDAFSSWVNDSDFTVTPRIDANGNPITDSNGNPQYRVSYNENNIVNNNSANITQLATDMINEMTAATMKVETNDPPITAGISVEAPKEVENNRYLPEYEANNHEMNIQIGANAGEAIYIDLPELDSVILGLGGLNVSSHASAGASITAVNKAISMVSEMRSELGAIQNRLQNASAVDDITTENTQASESRIRDADIAEEMVQYSKHNILLQASETILAQANQTAEGILKLLQ